MSLDDQRILKSPTGPDQSPVPIGGGIMRIPFTYADFNVAAETVTLKVLELSSARQIFILDAWVKVGTSTLDSVVMGLGDESAQDGFLRDIDLTDVLGWQGKARNERGVYFLENRNPLVGAGGGFLGSVNDPTITCTNPGSTMDALTQGAWDVYIQYAWVDIVDHPAAQGVSKASTSTPSAAAFTPQASWKTRSYSHTTGAINHDGASSEDFSIAVGSSVWILESVEFQLVAGTEAKGLDLIWYIDSGRTKVHPLRQPQNFSDLTTYFRIESNTDLGEVPLYMQGLELNEEDGKTMYFRLNDANAGGGSGTYKIIFNTREFDWEP